MKRYAVKETFGPTLQGEGPNTGRSCYFLRFAGCNAWDGRLETKHASACPYCDTDFAGGEKLSVEEVLSQLPTRTNSGLVITGGEPLLQLDDELLGALTPRFDWIDIETNGTVKPKYSALPMSVSISCSPKRIEGKPLVITSPTWWKILIPHQERFIDLALSSGLPIYVQPVINPDVRDAFHAHGYKHAVERCMEWCHNFPGTVRMSVQVHKYIGLR